MKKIISFSLWGTNPKYTVGAIKNAALAETVYPGWICRFYVGQCVDDFTVESLCRFKNTEVIIIPDVGSWKSMYWRFYPASEDDVDAMISRDTDSRLNSRERAAVDEWLTSDRGFHTMRDHPAHGIGILGGMWGAKKGVIPNMKELIDKHITNEDRWGIDQDFLCKVIEPMVNNNWMEHDAFYAIDHRNEYKRAFPTPRDRKTMRYVGEPFNEKDVSEIILKDPGHD